MKKSTKSEARIVEQVFEAIVQETWPETRVDESQSKEGIESFERAMAFEQSLKAYEAARKKGDVDVMTALTEDEDLRRYVLAQSVRKAGRPTGSGNALAQENAGEARNRAKVLKKIWPTLNIKGLPKDYSKDRVAEIIEAIYRDHFKAPLPIGWMKVH